jgi:hypothetical protein
VTRSRSRKVGKSDETPEFIEFWSIWRRHARHTDGRGLARDEFFRHLDNGADPHDIVDGAKCFFRTMKDKDKEFVPLSQTWLNRRSYEDLAEQQREWEARSSVVVERRESVVSIQLPKNHFMNRFK